MKKYISILLLAMFSFFFFDVKVNAKNFTINYDVNEHFNFFYEQKNNTTFYQFLMLNAKDGLKEIMCSFSSSSMCSDTFDNKSIKIITYKDYLEYGNHGNLYPNSKYVFYASNSNNQILRLVNGKYFIDSFNYGGNVEFWFVDENGDFLGYNRTDKIYLDDLDIEKNLLYSNNDMAYLISSYYLGNEVLSNDYSLSLNYLIFDDERIPLDFDSLNWFERLSKKFTFGFIGLFDDVSWDIPDNYGLEYFHLNNYSSGSKKVLGLYNILYYDSEYASLSVPEGFNTQSYSYDDRYFIIPNSLTCSSNDSLLYFSSTDYNNINVVSYTLNNSNLLNNEIKSFSFKNRKSNYIEAMSLNSYVEKYTDYLYMIYSSNNKSTNLFYYNPNCYSVYSAISSENIEFLNINTNENMIITPSEQKIIYNKVSDVSSDLAIEETDDVDISSFITSAWSGAKTFLLAALRISTLSTQFFNTLPSEVGAILLCGFTVGAVIILWKIFRS